jgi:polar amino acid transport system permease protein
MPYEWDFSPVFRNGALLLEGLVNTLWLAAAAIVLGLVAGLALALMRRSGVKPLAWPAIAIIEFFRNTPPLVHFFWFFYALPILIGVSLSPFLAALLALTIQSGAFFAEVYRAGIDSIERGQWEAGRAIGMSYATLMRRIILPQAIRRMIPPFVERAFELTKTTALAATLAYGELLYRAMMLSSQTFRPLEIYTAVAVLYFAVLFLASLAMRVVEHRLQRAQR